MKSRFIEPINKIIQRLVEGDFDGLVRDGYSELTEGELRFGVEEYPGTLAAIPDEGWKDAEVYTCPEGKRVEVPLWTEEEGRSDLYLYVLVRENGGRERFCIIDLDVP